MILYTQTSAIDSAVVSWAIYDGTTPKDHLSGDCDEPPYETGLAAMRAGWRVIQISQLIPPYPGEEYSTSFQPFEIVLEKLVMVDEKEAGDE